MDRHSDRRVGMPSFPSLLRGFDSPLPLHVFNDLQGVCLRFKTLKAVIHAGIRRKWLQSQLRGGMNASASRTCKSLQRGLISLSSNPVRRPEGELRTPFPTTSGSNVPSSCRGSWLKVNYAFHDLYCMSADPHVLHSLIEFTCAHVKVTRAFDLYSL